MDAKCCSEYREKWRSLTAIAVCRVICIFQGVNCYEMGQEPYSPQRDL